MNVEFREVDLEGNFDTCFEFRKDSYVCSFGSEDGFKESIEGYKDRISRRIESNDWFYIHLWKNGKIIGQIEFRSFSQIEGFGYVHLFYLVGEYRGSGAASVVHDYVVSVLSGCGCKGAVLSVSRTNTRALKFYEKCGWKHLGPNPKHESTEFYQIEFGI